MPGNSTSCPGCYYPFEQVTPGAALAMIEPASRNVAVPRQHKPSRAGWWNLGLVRWIAKIRAQGDADRMTVGDADPLVIPLPRARPMWWGEMMAWKKSQR